MRKDEALAALGLSVPEAAREIGISAQAIYDWPDELPPRIRDRVQAVLWRRLHGGTAAADCLPRCVSGQVQMVGK
jgi:hypothetical protein